MSNFAPWNSSVSPHHEFPSWTRMLEQSLPFGGWVVGAAVGATVGAAVGGATVGATVVGAAV